jgi:hypothetical protein
MPGHQRVIFGQSKTPLRFSRPHKRGARVVWRVPVLVIFMPPAGVTEAPR